jgi:hypothetical protein
MLQIDCRPLLPIVLVANALFVAPVRAQQSVIEVSYVEVQNAVSPKTGIFRIPRTLKVKLGEENTLDVTTRSGSGDRAQTLSQQVRPGESVQVGIAATRWHVGGPDVLIRETSLPRHVIRTTIRVSRKTCQAKVSFTLNPGETRYEMRWTPTGEPAFFRAIHAEKIACRLVDE